MERVDDSFTRIRFLHRLKDHGHQALRREAILKDLPIVVRVLNIVDNQNIHNVLVAAVHVVLGNERRLTFTLVIVILSRQPFSSRVSFPVKRVQGLLYVVLTRRTLEEPVLVFHPRRFAFLRRQQADDSLSVALLVKGRTPEASIFIFVRGLRGSLGLSELRDLFHRDTVQTFLQSIKIKRHIFSFFLFFSYYQLLSVTSRLHDIE